MRKVFRFEILAEIPEGNDDAGAEAVIATREEAKSIHEKLTKLGLTDIKVARGAINKREPKAPSLTPATPPVAHDNGDTQLATAEWARQFVPAVEPEPQDFHHNEHGVPIVGAKPHVMNLPGTALPTYHGPRNDEESVF